MSQLLVLPGDSLLSFGVAPNDGRFVVACGGTRSSNNGVEAAGEIRSWDLPSKRCDEFRKDARAFSHLAISKQGAFVAVAACDVTYDSAREVVRKSSVRVWDFGDRRLLHVLDGHGDSVTGLVFSPDGETLATTGTDGWVRDWDLGTGKITVSMRESIGTNDALAISPDGCMIAAEDEKNSVSVWNSNGAPLGRIGGFDDAVDSIRFSPDSKRIAIGAGAVDVWTTPR